MFPIHGNGHIAPTERNQQMSATLDRVTALAMFSPAKETYVGKRRAV